MQSASPPLSARHVRVIRALSEHRRLSEAAESVAMSQPAFSRTLHDAEARLAVPLFQRGWSGSEPTATGEIVIDQCRRIAADLEQVERGALAHEGPLRLPKLVRWRHLRAVSAVVRHGTVSAAARSLGMSQPAVSQSLGDMTAYISPALFIRRRTGMEPTDAARAMAALWDRVSAALADIPALIAETGDALVGRVSVGMLPFSGQTLVLQAFGEITQAHPRVQLVAVPGGYDTLIEALRRGEIDLILGVLREPSPFPEMEEEHLYYEDYMMIARADHPVHTRRPTMAELAKEQWIVAPHGTPIRRFFDRMFRAAGTLPPAQSAEMFSFSNAEQMILASRSIALLCYGKSGLRNLPEALRPVDMRLPGSRVSIGITRYAESPPSDAVTTFLSILRARVRAAEDA
ncbi:MAG: LysR family transcriptional regulator [Pseudomonadota bacterium]|nr:LysR family transcriptional regulator [Pseudomonadota bacterium]